MVWKKQVTKNKASIPVRKDEFMVEITSEGYT